MPEARTSRYEFMLENNPIPNQALRNAMGDKGVQPEAAKQENTLDSYTVLAFRGKDLPDQYLNLIRSKWMRSLRTGNDFFKLASAKEYYQAYGLFIPKILS